MIGGQFQTQPILATENEPGIPEFVNIEFNERVNKDDLDLIFKKLNLPSLQLTGRKVRKSKQAVQDAFSVLNQNMVTIDQNMRDMLFLLQDLTRVLYVCMDSRIAHLMFNLTRTNQRMKLIGSDFSKTETRMT
mmetsp:Transcript_31215/g.36626  ORF Transcript_31215/g.36626 Transcript_31215/m.36626 type:complete len:133 (+) Transcript_31215:77-475(+)